MFLVVLCCCLESFILSFQLFSSISNTKAKQQKRISLTAVSSSQRSVTR